MVASKDILRERMSQIDDELREMAIHRSDLLWERKGLNEQIGRIEYAETRIMKPHSRQIYIVMLACPPGVSSERMRQYIEDEIKANVGALPPEDPLFHLDRDTVEVSIKR